jgi:hypothetical protein
MRTVPFASLLLLALAGSTAQADVRLDYTTQGADSPLSRLEIAGHLMRSDSGGNSVIVDTRRNEFVAIDHEQKQYTRIDAARMEKLAGAASAAMQQARSLLDSLPPDQRKALEERLGGHMPGATATRVTMDPTGKHETVAGHDCEVYAMSVNGSHDQDLCLADAGEVGLGAADREALHDAFAYFKRMAEKFSAGTGQVELPFDEMANGRVPLKIVVYDGGKVQSSSELKSVATTALPAGDFVPPAGYTEQAPDLPGLPH